MRKNLIIIIHLLAVLIFAAGLGAVHQYSRNGSGISWIDSSSFEDSVLFSEMVEDDIANLKRFAILKAAFEDEGDGEPNTDNMVVTAVTDNGKMAYTLSELISQAARYGYTMDSVTHRISMTENAETESPYELRVTYKAFDPFYFENTEIGPSQGVTNIRDLSVEALKAFAEYYSLRAVYDTDMTNFAYNASFESNGDFLVLFDNTRKTTEEIKSLGRYLIVNEERTIETNIVPQPENVLSEDNSYALSSDDGNALEIGIDTSYLFDDRYKRASDNFTGDIRKVKIWLIVMGAAVLTALTTLVFVVRGFDEKDRRELTMDKIPLEALVFLFGCAAVIVYVLFKLTVNTAFEELLEYADWEYWRDMAKGVIIWLFAVSILSSMYRRELNGGCFSHSLISGLFGALSDDRKGRAAWNALKGYAAFIAVNVIGVIFIINCYHASVEGTIYTIAMWIAGAVLAAFDIFIYVLRYRSFRQREEIRGAVRDIADGDVDIKLDESRFSGSALEIVKGMNNISVGLNTAINEQVKADKLKADLITNVSHDIRTPLTSIINYVDLLKREDVDNPKIREYVDVLDKKSARLKNLTEDLLEASKASSGNIKIELAVIDMVELCEQAGGEFEDKFKKRNLSLEMDMPDNPLYVKADGRHLWRVFENLYNNAAKYAMEGTRIYADVTEKDGRVRFTLKNVSQDKLNISPDELTERFVRGDVSRNTEGSGLGLSIAKSLTTLMGGELLIEIDGDLYKASVIMDRQEAPKKEETAADNENGAEAPDTVAAAAVSESAADSGE